MKHAQSKHAKHRYYHLNSILGNTWAVFYIIIGPRKTGKSYSVTDFLCNENKELGDQAKNYWLRISDTSTKALLANKANKLVDEDLVRKYKLQLTTKGMDVYNHGQKFMTVCPLASFGKLKGVAFYDKDFRGNINIVLDEFQLEKGEKRTSFDILYNFMGMVENISRTTKVNIRVFLLGNTLEEASTILRAFNFIPEQSGRFYLVKNKKKLLAYLDEMKHAKNIKERELIDIKYRDVDFGKRAVIDNLEVSEDYLADRKGSLADILGGGSTSNFNNEIAHYKDLIYEGRLRRPSYLLKFGRTTDEWFVLWDDLVIARYKKEQINSVIAMRPYLNEMFLPELRDNIVDKFDAKYFRFKDLVSQAYFTEALTKIRK